MATARQRRDLIDVCDAFGVGIATESACQGHSAPIDFLAAWVFDRPSVSLVCGPRGGGKSYLASFATHLDSIRHDVHGTRVLGGSLAQSQQIYGALRDFDRAQPDLGLFLSFTKTQATYATGSEVSILAASPTSVRGPHVATLRLDEVDEIDADIRESAMGMCMAQHGVSASVSMTSTWHKVGGPMSELIARGQAGEFPVYTFCAFEILERCPKERSGPNLENCPSCPLVKWCHDTQDGIPKAKRSAGHYAIDSLIQKAMILSRRTFEADYLCLGPKADGLWFKTFDHVSPAFVTPSAEYDPALPVWLAIDTGVFTAAVWFQVANRDDPHRARVTVFADFLAEGATAEANARSMLETSRRLCNGRIDHRVTDPAGGSRTASGGPTVKAEYARVGLPLIDWPHSRVADGLALIESFLMPAIGESALTIHPRCKELISAFRSYRRKKHRGQWMDYPEDPQHTAEDLMDSLRGGLNAVYPNGRKSTKSIGRGPNPARHSRG